MRRWFTLAVLVFAVLSPIHPVDADPKRSAEFFAAGLDNPRGLVVAADGTVLVAEAGLGGSNSTEGECEQAPGPVGPFTGGPTARVSHVGIDGTRTTFSDSLPSTQTSPPTGSQVEGAEEVVFLDGIPYVLTQGGGCSKGNPGQPNGIYRLDPDGDHTLVADLSAYFAANPTEGPQDSDRDPEGVPTSMVVADGSFYVLEGNHAQLVEVGTDGSISRIADLSLIGQLTYTGLEIGPDGDFYVATFGEHPYPSGGADLFRVTMSGEVSHIRGGLTNVIDIRFDCRGHLHLLEASTGNTGAPPFLNPGSGRVLRLTGNRLHVVVEDLDFPGGMAFGPDGRLYVTNHAFDHGPTSGVGEVVRVDVAGPSACPRLFD